MSKTNLFFFPAMWIMSRLNYYSKMFWLFVLAASITLSSTFLYIERLNADIEGSLNKLEALKIAKSIAVTTQAIQTYRAKSSVCMFEVCPDAKIAMYEGMVSDTLLALKKNVTLLDKSQSTETFELFSQAKESFHQGDFYTFVEQIDSLIVLLEKMKFSMTLHLGINNEASQNVYMLMQNSLFDSNELIENFSLLDTYAVKILAQKSLDTNSFNVLKNQINTAEFLFKHFLDDYNNYQSLSANKKTILTNYKNYLEVIESELFTQKLRYAPDALLYDSKLFSDAIRVFQADALNELKLYYQKGLRHAMYKKNAILLMLFIGSVIWFYFFIGYYFVLKRSIDSIEKITKDVAKGELHKRIEEDTQDEFSTIVELINSMIGSLEGENRMLSEYKKALDASAPICKTDKEGVITYVNEAYENLTKYSAKELIGNTHALLRSSKSSDVKYQALWQDILDKNIHQATFENRDKEGNAFFVKSTIVPVVNQHAQIKEFIAIMTNITDIHVKNEALEFQLLHDSLTKLPNRVALSRAIERSYNTKLMLLNIDRFHDINSIYGERLADELLIQVAERVGTLLDSARLHLYKLSGDEYAVLADEGVSSQNFQEDVILLAHFLNPIKLTTTIDEISLRISIGAVIANQNQRSRPVLSMAKEALQRAKQHPRGYQFFQHISQENSVVERNIKILEHLEYAIENKKVKAHFQPIFSLKKNKITKFETLIRLVDSSSNILYPADFMDIAKHSRLYSTLTKLIVKEAICKAEENRGFYFSVNISYEDMLDSQTINHIYELLQKTDAADRIIFEMLESAEIEENQIVENFINHVKGLGSSIAIDDFGSGYSNYAYLMNAGVDIVKIDGSLISLIDRDENVRKIVDSIIKIAHDLDIETVAEFVSSRSIYDTLVELNIDNVQGSYIGNAKEELLLDKKL